MFKFLPEVTEEHKKTFVRELKKLKELSCVKGHRLVRSKGFEFGLLSFHESLEDLEKYQASKEHHWVTSTYMFPSKEDLIRFDFEVSTEDEHMFSCFQNFGLEEYTLTC
ncbi:hypothetical protein BDW67DRAFT_178983 [Aspergillus spinulosporus]